MKLLGAALIFAAGALAHSGVVGIEIDGIKLAYSIYSYKTYAKKPQDILPGTFASILFSKM
jgi:hypothetical protein